MTIGRRIVDPPADELFVVLMFFVRRTSSEGDEPTTAAERVARRRSPIGNHFERQGASRRCDGLELPTKEPAASAVPLN